MTQVFENQTFRCFYDQDSGAVFSDLEFRDCSFESCRISITEDPKLRSVVRNVKLVNCSQRGCAIDAAILEDVVVDGLKTRSQLLQIWGAVFKHVVLKGRIDRVMITWSLGTIEVDKPEIQRAFLTSNMAFYREVDWALDISGAEVNEIDIRGIPASLIRRDPETQVVVTRERAMETPWKDMDLNETLWKTWIAEFLDSEIETDVVLAAPKRHRNYYRLLEDLHRLRDAGVAQPD
jgi:hypothetical protein